MATMTVSLPDPVKDWIEARVRDGDYASASDYLRDLVNRDRARQGAEYSLDELRSIIDGSRASGAGRRSLDDLFAAAEKAAAARGTLHE